MYFQLKCCSWTLKSIKSAWNDQLYHCQVTNGTWLCCSDRHMHMQTHHTVDNITLDMCESDRCTHRTVHVIRGFAVSVCNILWIQSVNPCAFQQMIVIIALGKLAHIGIIHLQQANAQRAIIHSDLPPGVSSLFIIDKGELGRGVMFKHFYPAPPTLVHRSVFLLLLLIINMLVTHSVPRKIQICLTDSKWCVMLKRVSVIRPNILIKLY